MRAKLQAVYIPRLHLLKGHTAWTCSCKSELFQTQVNGQMQLQYIIDSKHQKKLTQK